MGSHLYGAISILLIDLYFLRLEKLSSYFFYLIMMKFVFFYDIINIPAIFTKEAHI